jgi:gas vesicle protein
MANGHDGSDNENKGYGGSFVMGLVTGTVLGAGLGMLFAPKAGSDLRRELGEQAGNLANNAAETYRKASSVASDWAGKAQDTADDFVGKASEAAGDWAERGKDLYGKAREAVATGMEEGQRAVRDSASHSGGSTTGPRRS